MLERLKQKQEIFDAFADKSSAADAQNQNEISDKTFNRPNFFFIYITLYVIILL